MALVWLLTAFFAFHPAEAVGPRKLLLFLGGSGDPPGETTQFDSNAAIFGQFAKVGGWESTALFDGSHAASTQSIKQAFGPETQTFTPDHARAALSSFDKMLKSGGLNEGDEILIVIDNHGAAAAAGEQTHSLITDDARFSLDELRPLLTRLSAAGVRTGILDSSCFSGATQALAGAKTCVVSQGAATRVGYNNSAFAMAFVPGQSLESAYLAGRYSDHSPDFPEISSPAGRRTAAFFRPLLDHSYTALGEPDYEPAKPCAEQANDASQLSQLVQNLGDVLAHSELDPSDTENFSLTYQLPMLKKRIQGYDETLAQHEAVLRKLNELSDQPGPIQYITGRDGQPLTLGEIEGLLARPEQEEEIRKMLHDDKTDPAGSAVGLEELDKLDKLANSPAIQAIKGIRQLLWRKDGGSTSLYQAAKEIGEIERSMYPKVYAQELSGDKASQKGEPCASFTL
jgi:hypothetical protein